MPKSYKNKVQYDGDLLQGDDRTEWEFALVKALDAAWATYTGRNVLDELGMSSNIVKIVPYYDTDMNASAAPRNFADAYVAGRPLRWPDHGEKAPTGGVGTGKGTGVRLNYTPWRYPWELRPVKLIHEMTHAAEQQRGVLYCMTVHSACFDTVAEFDAILVENIIRSELGLHLRKDHHGNQKLSGTRMLPQEGELRSRIESFKGRMPHLTHALANVRAPYNPLRPGSPGAA